ncbi:MAG TPA: hypothetical protein VFT92_05210 [Nitrospira sp.]|nr:hypothetical protein [Nitrospira sp.]
MTGFDGRGAERTKIGLTIDQEGHTIRLLHSPAVPTGFKEGCMRDRTKRDVTGRLAAGV